MQTAALLCARPDEGAPTPTLGRITMPLQRAGGRLLVVRDDLVVAAFTSAVGAVTAAIEVGRIGARSATPSAVAIHVADLDLDRADLDRADLDRGPATEVPVGLRGTAAFAVLRRLADAAAPGEILASEVARLLVIDHEPDGFEPWTDPVENVTGFRVRWAPAARGTVRVVVGEDVPLVRAGIVALLREEGFDVVGEAGDLAGLLAVAEQVRPDLLVTDVRMPPTQRDEGIVAAARLRARFPGLGVVVLSQHVDGTAAAALLDGTPSAVGYLLKERVADIDDFVAACWTVVDGGVVVDPLVAEALARTADRGLEALSARERDVLALMASGRSNTAIARTLHCSTKTLETHVRSIFRKLDLPEDPDGHRRVAAVVRYLGAGHRG